MMRHRILSIAFGLMVTAAPLAWSAEVQGTWHARLAEERPGKLYVSLETGRNNQHGSFFEPSEFPGLSRADLESSTRTPVRFELERDAGTLSFDGTFRGGRGSGDFTFTPNPEFVSRLRGLGVRHDRKYGNDDRELLSVALFDVSIDFIRSMQAIGYREPLEKYIAFRIFNVNPEYVNEMADLGFEDLKADKLVETRIHGATPEYIREMRAGGEDLPLDEYIQSRIFQVTPEFAREMSRAGYSGVDRNMLVQFKIHGVTPEFIDELRELGYSRLSASKLVEMRIHQVTPEFIRRVAKAGYRNVPVDKLVQMRIFNVDPEMVRALDDGNR